MHTSLVGVVEDHRIPRQKIVAVVIKNDGHCLRHSTEMKSYRLRLGNHIAGQIANSSGKIHYIFNDF